ncbi:Taurine hydroxylase SAT17 [Hyphodiscus hymeniophilus]|uniref:Taurine hydroxylase SAT17 n=1 Tax=Hyphodiscus hymeniophilus TaxID=353542 RepID=A0A9P6SQU7_9HELO|nr:Taurine hydroxylase SAT17 [Hyphodiscus hymeniophilus]
MTETPTSGGEPPMSDYFSQTKSSSSTNRDNGVPAGFPKAIVSPSVWSGKDLVDEMRRYALTLEESHIKEIEQACKRFRELGLTMERVSQETFPLATLGEELKTLAAQLTNGVGFFVLRGLEPERYSNEENVVIYLGISSYIGETRGRQDEQGNMLLHLTDLGSALAGDHERQAPYSSVGQPFHTDTGDIVGLYSLGEAAVGGESNLVSTAVVYDELIKTRPDIIRLLASSSWVFDSFGLSPAYKTRPLLYPINKEKVLLAFARRPLVGHAWSPRSPGIPTLSASHVEALYTLQNIAEKHALSMKLKRGELLFWNNLALMHSRNGFTDAPDSRRHLLRLWLRNDATVKGWTIPEELQGAWKDAYDHQGRAQLWPVETIKDREYIINQQRASGHD